MLRRFLFLTARTGIGALLFSALAPNLQAAEKEEVKATPPPEIKMLAPFGVMVGETNQLKVRGLNFTNISSIKVSGVTNAAAIFKPPVKSDPPKGTEKDDAGDHLLELSLFIPPQTAPKELELIVVSAAGQSKPQKALVLSKETLVPEKEPNAAFNKAQPIKAGQTIQGAIETPNDVDVFSFEAVQGDKFQIVIAARKYGSALDSLVSVFDAKQHFLAGSDDAETRDSDLEFQPKAAGLYYISLMDASDSGSPLHLYYLQLLKANK